jgi:hypothetical protein
MRKILINIIPVLLCSCGQQLETREHMDYSAIKISDSINRSIDSALADPAKELNKVNQMSTVKTTTEEDK